MNNSFDVTVVDGLDEEYKPQPKSKRRAAPTVSEASVKDAGMRKIHAAGGYAIAKHMTGSGKRGTPDVLACVRGRMVVIEFKRPEQTPTPAQLGELRRWQDAGALAGWVQDPAQVDHLLEHLPDPSWRNSFEHPGDGRNAGDPW